MTSAPGIGLPWSFFKLPLIILPFCWLESWFKSSIDSNSVNDEQSIQELLEEIEAEAERIEEEMEESAEQIESEAEESVEGSEGSESADESWREGN